MRGAAGLSKANGVPAEAQRSGFGGGRTSSGVNEPWYLCRGERYAACEDAPPAAYFPARESRQSSPWGNRRGRALSGPNAPVSPWYPPFGVRPAAAKFNDPPNLRAVTMPVRCPVYRYCIARAGLPAQTCEPLQFNDLSQCRTQSLRRVSASARGNPSLPPGEKGGICEANDG